MSANDLQLGPSQRDVYRVLEEDGGELRSGEIAEQCDRLGSRSVNAALRRLSDRGLVNVRDSGNPRGWFLYSAIDSEGKR